MLAARRLTWRLKEDTLWKRGPLLYLRELRVFLVYEERRYQRPIYYHIELRYTTDTLSKCLFSGSTNFRVPY